MGSVWRVAEGRGWKLTINICTYHDIENMHVMLRAATNRDGGGEDGGKWAILVPHMVVAVDDIRYGIVDLRAGMMQLRCMGATREG